MEVGGDAATKQPLLDEDEEGDGVGSSQTSNGASSALGRVLRQQRLAQAADGARYGRLDEDADVGGPGEGDSDVGQFYECEEEALMVAAEAAEASALQEDAAASTPPGTPERAPSPAPAASSSTVSASSTAPALVLQPATHNARELPLRATATSCSTAPAIAERRPESDEEEPGSESVAIEMRSLITETSAASSVVDSLVATAAAPAAGGILSEPSSSSTAPGIGSPDRHCFICLQDEDEDNPLTPCCTTCFARVHVRCWREWRNNQRITALRSRLLGLRMQTNHLLRCTICKSGTALVAGEEDGLEWMNELLCGGGEAARNEGANPPTAGPMRRDESDEDNDAQFEELVDMKTCLALMVYLGVLVLVLLVACLLIVMQRFYAGDVILCCIIALYELSVLQIVALAVARRRTAQTAAAAAAAAAATPSAATAEDAAGAHRETEQSSLATVV